jgi:three-Cys-motif partner protein
MAQFSLFDYLPEYLANEVSFRAVKTPVWTENKANLVANYLRYFVFITKHGCYIDGFAGAKQPGLPGTWAAELVLESEPRWLREFFLCDLEPGKVADLKALRDRQPFVQNRKIEIFEGDFNERVKDILALGLIIITPKKATWATFEAIARHKVGASKIEIFYFLASGWLDRALSGFTKNVQIPEYWWGRSDWRNLRGMKSVDRALLLCERFKDEFWYRFAYPWPITERAGAAELCFT